MTGGRKGDPSNSGAGRPVAPSRSLPRTPYEIFFYGQVNNAEQHPFGRVHNPRASIRLDSVIYLKMKECFDKAGLTEEMQLKMGREIEAYANSLVNWLQVSPGESNKLKGELTLSPQDAKAAVSFLLNDILERVSKDPTISEMQPANLQSKIMGELHQRVSYVALAENADQFKGGGNVVDKVKKVNDAYTKRPALLNIIQETIETELKYYGHVEETLKDLNNRPDKPTDLIKQYKELSEIQARFKPQLNAFLNEIRDKKNNNKPIDSKFMTRFESTMKPLIEAQQGITCQLVLQYNENLQMLREQDTQKTKERREISPPRLRGKGEVVSQSPGQQDQGKLDIYSKLIMPVQRFMRYPMLFEEIKKKMDPTNETGRSSVLEFSKQYANEINERKGFYEELVKLEKQFPILKTSSEFANIKSAVLDYKNKQYAKNMDEVRISLHKNTVNALLKQTDPAALKQYVELEAHLYEQIKDKVKKVPANPAMQEIQKHYKQIPKEEGLFASTRLNNMIDLAKKEPFTHEDGLHLIAIGRGSLQRARSNSDPENKRSSREDDAYRKHSGSSPGVKPFQGARDVVKGIGKGEKEKHLSALAEMTDTSTKSLKEVANKLTGKLDISSPVLISTTDSSVKNLPPSPSPKRKP